VTKLKVEAKRVYQLQNTTLKFSTDEEVKQDPELSMWSERNSGIVDVKNVEWLKQRTIHVKGLHPND